MTPDATLRDGGFVHADRFWDRVDASGDCWEWTAGCFDTGYGAFAAQYDDGYKPRGAHRVAWRLLVGPIPHDLTIDHLCRNRACVNPDHMELVTRGENSVRGYGPTAKNRRKTRCKRGHPFDEENTYITPQGWRQCRECHRAKMRRRADARRFTRLEEPAEEI